MLIQKLAAFLAYHKKQMNPFDLYHWYAGRIEITTHGTLWTGHPDHEVVRRDCSVFRKVNDLVSAFEKPGAVIYDDNIMDRYWQRGRLMLVTKDFKTFDEATTRITKRGCRVCHGAAGGSTQAAELLRLVGICPRCNGLGQPLRYDPLWTCFRTVVAGRYRVDYNPVRGTVRYHTRKLTSTGPLVR